MSPALGQVSLRRLEVARLAFALLAALFGPYMRAAAAEVTQLRWWGGEWLFLRHRIC